MTQVHIEGAGEPASGPDGDKAAPQAAAPAPAESASAQLIREALKETVLTDAKGRKIRVGKPSVLAQFRIVEAVGPERATNQTYMQMVNPLIYVKDIDGDPIHLPATIREVEALIQRLDDDGLDALLGWYVEQIALPAAEAMQAAEEKARLKN